MPELPRISIADYSFDLLEEKIARYPLAQRDQSKLLVYREGQIIHSNFKSLAEFIPENSILFLNNTKVIPARLLFTKETGAVIEIFLLAPVWPSAIVALGLALAVIWACLLGYWVAKIIALAI